MLCASDGWNFTSNLPNFNKKANFPRRFSSPCACERIKKYFFSCAGYAFFYKIEYKREKEVGRMSRILRFFVCFGMLFFAGNALAAGYSCSSQIKYTSCNAGYYLSGSGVGNSCASCSSAQNTSVVSATLISNGKRTQTCTGYYTGGTAGSSGTDQCTGCSSSTYSCSCNADYHVSGSGSSCTCVADCTSDCTYDATQTVSCTASNASAASGTQTCNATKNSTSGCYTWGSTTNCTATSCNSGYYYSSGSCYSCTNISYTESDTDYDSASCSDSQTVTGSITGGGSYSQYQVRSGTKYRSRSMSRTCYRTGGAGDTSGSSSCTGSDCGSWTYDSWSSYGSCSWGSWTDSGSRDITCPEGTYWNGSSCGTCTAGYYCSGFSSVSESSLYNGYGRSGCGSTYTLSDSGATSSGDCYYNATKTGSQVNGSTPTNCYSVTSWNSCTPGTCTYRVYADGSTTSCTPTNCTKTVASVTAKTGYYANE